MAADRVDVAAGTTRHGAPRNPVAQLQHAVIVEEPCEGRGREPGEGGGVGRPDRGAERHEVPVEELA